MALSKHGRLPAIDEGCFLAPRGAGGGVERRAAAIHLRESAGSITSSIAKWDALLIAFPRLYIYATISTDRFPHSLGSLIAANSLR
jgi:hypothetical protein